MARSTISIHALREESDRAVLCRGSAVRPISIHALREESDDGSAIPIAHFFDFNPRPPRGERRRLSGVVGRFSDISIHALREESDLPPSQP